MKKEFYFKITATESEHGVIEKMIRDHCYNHNIEFFYYRKLKNGHIPMKREGKIGISPKYGAEILNKLEIPLEKTLTPV